MSLWASALGLTCFGTLRAVRLRRRGPPRLDAPFGLFPVSILKPLKGLDPSLGENLESFFNLDYPDYELWLCLANQNDPARKIAEGLIARYPRVQARITIAGERPNATPNPKVENLLHAFEHAAFDWILISDSNTRVPPDSLKRQVAHLSAQTGVLTSVIVGTEPQSLAAECEAAILNTYYARGMMLADAVDETCAVGKSMLFRRSEAKRFGGLQALGGYLAEDYMAGQAMRKLGLNVELACDPVVQPLGTYSWRAYWSRHVRWGRLRRAQAPVLFWVEPLFTLMGSAFFAAIASNDLGLTVEAVLAFHFGLWAACDAILIRTLGGPFTPRTAVAWWVREISALPLWAQILCGQTVTWRGQTLKVDKDGLLSLYTKP